MKQEMSGTRRGQAMVEYVIAVGVLLAMLGILAMLKWTLAAYGWRVVYLVGCEYP